MGKSSIPLIIEEAIFNKNSKGIKKADIPNRYLKKGYNIKLTFDKDDSEYEIHIDRKAATVKVKLIKNGEDISSHTATNTFKAIEEIVGQDFKTFSQLVYQNTNTSLQFLVATDTNRKKFLIDLLQLEQYVALFELFKEAVKQHAGTVSKIQGQIATVEKWIAQNSLQDTSIKELIPVDDLDLSSDEAEVAKLSLEITNIDKTNRAINKNNQYKELLAAINIEEINAIEAEPTLSYDDEQSQLGGLESEKLRITKSIRNLNSLGDTCPTCEQSIDPDFKQKLIEGDKASLKSVESKIEEIKKTIDSIKSNNSRYKHKQDSIKEWEELFSSINKTLPSATINKQDLVDELSNLSIRISNARDKLKKITQQNQEVAKHNSRVNVFLEQSDKFQEELAEYSAKLDKELANLNNLELLKKSFSTNGLVAYKIENMVKDLEELTNDYLAELSDGRFTIEFSVMSDKLNVNITDNGNNVDILALSSGELARVNTSTLLALRKLMSSISKSRINVLFLDEVINVLDEAGREKLVEVLLNEELNTYIVSHGWSHPLLTKLEVIKEDNISRIEHD
jgi:DNA repair exonuclease SbcCD ATPase subunit